MWNENKNTCSYGSFGFFCLRNRISDSITFFYYRMFESFSDRRLFKVRSSILLTNLWKNKWNFINKKLYLAETIHVVFQELFGQLNISFRPIPAILVTSIKIKCSRFERKYTVTYRNIILMIIIFCSITIFVSIV